jgi:hypothetical protein
VNRGPIVKVLSKASAKKMICLNKINIAIKIRDDIYKRESKDKENKKRKKEELVGKDFF